jgi:kynurenine formamidase
MPHYPTHAPFLYSLTKRHGEYVNPGGGSSAAEAIALGTHVGTHIDALCHFSCDGKLHGGVAVEGRQSVQGGLSHLSIDTVPLILRRGVLLDIAGSAGLDALPVDFTITPAHLDAAAEAQGTGFQAGDVILVRTGWARYYHDAARYISEVRGPGPEIDGARWLSGRKPFAVGSDTVAFEKVPSPSMAVHVHLLFEQGIHIIEVLNLEELARDKVYEFVFAGAPLKIQGGTGAPIRPFALA